MLVALSRLWPRACHMFFVSCLTSTAHDPSRETHTAVLPCRATGRPQDRPRTHLKMNHRKVVTRLAAPSRLYSSDQYCEEGTRHFLAVRTSPPPSGTPTPHFLWKPILSVHCWKRRRITEALLIAKHRPALNKQVQAFTLSLFPMGIT